MPQGTAEHVKEDVAPWTCRRFERARLAWRTRGIGREGRLVRGGLAHVLPGALQLQQEPGDAGGGANERANGRRAGNAGAGGFSGRVKRAIIAVGRLSTLESSACAIPTIGGTAMSARILKPSHRDAMAPVSIIVAHAKLVHCSVPTLAHLARECQRKYCTSYRNCVVYAVCLHTHAPHPCIHLQYHSIAAVALGARENHCRFLPWVRATFSF